MSIFILLTAIVVNLICGGIVAGGIFLSGWLITWITHVPPSLGTIPLILVGIFSLLCGGIVFVKGLIVDIHTRIFPVGGGGS